MGLSYNICLLILAIVFSGIVLVFLDNIGINEVEG